MNTNHSKPLPRRDEPTGWKFPFTDGWQGDAKTYAILELGGETCYVYNVKENLWHPVPTEQLINHPSFQEFIKKRQESPLNHLEHEPF